ncbi:hypothetical protein GCM10020260_16470 [Nesterenkonia halobia]|uniref:V8-like Glu-specific endopeptidase n=1 Tax=Nesterenkonia halobia TaxID=37922 RepID=A0ABP6RCL3_9MICC
MAYLMGGTAVMRTRRLLGVGGVLGLGASVMLAGPAAATPGAPEDGGGAGGVPVEQLDAVDQDAAADYWTPRRMAAARPALPEQAAGRAGEVTSSLFGTIGPGGLGPDVDLGPDRGPGEAAGPPEATAAQAGRGPAAGPKQGRDSRQEQAGSGAQDPAASPHVGKIFYSTAEGDFVCSGNLVESANGSTVSTAGHCVVDGGEFVDNLVFAPAYDHGVSEHGLWAAEELTTTAAWAESGDFEQDAGFAVLETRDGRTAAEVVGEASPIVFDQPRDLFFTAYGYPAVSPYDGEALHRCQGQAQDDPYGSSTRGIPCDMTGGSSGGPWFIGDGPDGAQNSVNSYSYRDDPDTMYGPYFGPAVEEVYTYAASR